MFKSWISLNRIKKIQAICQSQIYSNYFAPQSPKFIVTKFRIISERRLKIFYPKEQFTINKYNIGKSRHMTHNTSDVGLITHQLGWAILSELYAFLVKRESIINNFSSSISQIQEHSPKLQINLCFFIPVNNFQSKIHSNGQLIIWWKIP